MTVYEYHCVFCHTVQERRVPMEERDKQTCELCGEQLARQWSGNPIIIRGKWD